MVVLWKASFILACTLWCHVACLGVRVCLSFFSPVVFFPYAIVLDMIFLWLAVSFCLKVGHLLTLLWHFCFDLLIPIKGLLASIRGITLKAFETAYEILSCHMGEKYWRCVHVRCASAIWCINQYMLSLCVLLTWWSYAVKHQLLYWHLLSLGMPRNLA